MASRTVTRFVRRVGGAMALTAGVGMAGMGGVLALPAVASATTPACVALSVPGNGPSPGNVCYTITAGTVPGDATVTLVSTTLSGGLAGISTVFFCYATKPVSFTLPSQCAGTFDHALFAGEVTVSTAPFAAQIPIGDFLYLHIAYGTPAGTNTALATEGIVVSKPPPGTPLASPIVAVPVLALGAAGVFTWSRRRRRRASPAGHRVG